MSGSATTRGKGPAPTYWTWAGATEKGQDPRRPPVRCVMHKSYLAFGGDAGGIAVPLHFRRPKVGHCVTLRQPPLASAARTGGRLARIGYWCRPFADRAWREVRTTWDQVRRQDGDVKAGYVTAFVLMILTTLLLELIWGRGTAWPNPQLGIFQGVPLLYLVFVLGLALRFGIVVGVIGAVMATFAMALFAYGADSLRHGPPAPVAACPTFVALVVVAVLAGRLTYDLRGSVRRAQQQHERMERLYENARLIVDAAEQDHLLRTLAQRMLDLLRPAGGVACSLIVPSETGDLVVQARAPARGPLPRPLALAAPEHLAEATWAKQHGKVSMVGVENIASLRSHSKVAYYVPLRSRDRVVGLLSVAGTWNTALLLCLLADRDLTTCAGSQTGHADRKTPEEYLGLTLHLDMGELRTFYTQLAIAIDRELIHRDIIDAEVAKLKRDFHKFITHDFVKNIDRVKKYIHDIARDAEHVSESGSDYLVASLTALGRDLSDITENLSEMYKLEQGKLRPTRENFPFDDISSDMLRRLSDEDQHRIQFDVPVDLPFIYVDGRQIGIVLNSLVSNALKWSPSDAPVRVHCSAVAGDSPQLLIRVSDQGLGIPPDQLETIFDKGAVVQVDQAPASLRHIPPQWGLGLFLCAQIVKAHGGRIWAESTGIDGQGSTFIVQLPMPDPQPPG